MVKKGIPGKFIFSAGPPSAGFSAGTSSIPRVIIVNATNFPIDPDQVYILDSRLPNTVVLPWNWIDGVKPPDLMQA